MPRVSLILLVGLMACDPMPSGDPLAPVSVKKAPAQPGVGITGTAVAGAEDVGTTTGGFDFDAEDRKEDEEAATTDLDPLDVHAGLLGVDPADVIAPAPRPSAAAAQPVAVNTGLPRPYWDADQPIDGSWGIRVLATLHEVQPPRAVVVMPTGEELVVQPGEMLPSHRMVILAIGQNAVQVARVTPQGFFAKVETETVATLSPGATR